MTNDLVQICCVKQNIAERCIKWASFPEAETRLVIDQISKSNSSSSQDRV